MEQKINYLQQFYELREILDYAQGDDAKLTELYDYCQPQEVMIGDIENTEDLFVDSPDGFVPVTAKVEKGEYEIFEIEFVSGKTVKASEYHMFQRSDSVWLTVSNLKVGTPIIGKDTLEMIRSVRSLGFKDLVYDLSVDHENHRFFTNDICSHNSGTGKSVFLQNLAVNWVEMGLHVIYISLELSENLCAMRIDAMVTDCGTRDVIKNREEVSVKLRNYSKKHGGSLRIKQMKNGSTANDVKAYIKECEIQTGIKADAIVLDYLDLFMPTNLKISPENLFVKDKYVTENLRDLAVELDTLMATASQLNRSSFESAKEGLEFSHASIAGGISKINTADNVFAIFTNAIMKEEGLYQLQLMKTRSSSGVGSTVDLEFNPKTLRIFDADPNSPSVMDKVQVATTNKLKSDSAVIMGGDSKGSADSSNDVDSNASKNMERLRDIISKNKK
jgi:hypothetical protein